MLAPSRTARYPSAPPSGLFRRPWRVVAQDDARRGIVPVPFMELPPCREQGVCRRDRDHGARVEPRRPGRGNPHHDIVPQHCCVAPWRPSLPGFANHDPARWANPRHIHRSPGEVAPSMQCLRQSRAATSTARPSAPRAVPVLAEASQASQRLLQKTSLPEASFLRPCRIYVALSQLRHDGAVGRAGPPRRCPSPRHSS
jgi:hypothetical protein